MHYHNMSKLVKYILFIRISSSEPKPRTNRCLLSSERAPWFKCQPLYGVQYPYNTILMSRFKPYLLGTRVNAKASCPLPAKKTPLRKTDTAPQTSSSSASSLSFAASIALILSASRARAALRSALVLSSPPCSRAPIFACAKGGGVTATPAFEYAPGLGAEVAVLPGDRALNESWFESLPVGLRMELIDDNLFELSESPWLAESTSRFEKERFRDGERNEAGDSEDWRSSKAPRDIRGGSRFSSVRNS